MKQATYIEYVTTKLSKSCQNQHAHLLRFLFTEDSLEIQNLKLSSKPHFPYNFLMKSFLL